MVIIVLKEYISDYLSLALGGIQSGSNCLHLQMIDKINLFTITSWQRDSSSYYY